MVQEIHEVAQGKINIIHTDNGGEFRDGDLEEFILKINAKHVFGAPYHPQSQGVVECANGTIKQFILVDHVSRACEIYLTTFHGDIFFHPYPHFSIHTPIFPSIGNLFFH